MKRIKYVLRTECPEGYILAIVHLRSSSARVQQHRKNDIAGRCSGWSVDSRRTSMAICLVRFTLAKVCMDITGCVYSVGRHNRHKLCRQNLSYVLPLGWVSIRTPVGVRWRRCIRFCQLSAPRPRVD